jgi:hypothetical protein
MILRIFFFIRVEEFYKNATLASSSKSSRGSTSQFTTHFYKTVDRSRCTDYYFSDPVTCLDNILLKHGARIHKFR